MSSIRPYLSDASTAQLVSFHILCSLDYCNSALSGLASLFLTEPDYEKVQNNAARLVRCGWPSINEETTRPLQKKIRSYVTLLLKQLHWLPDKASIHYEMATLF